VTVDVVLTRAIVEGGWFDLWGAAEWFALIGLSVTIGGVWLAITTLDATKRHAEAAAEDTRRILENELAAKLEFAPNDRGQLIWGFEHPVPDGRQYLQAQLRSVGRYPARDIEIEIYHGDQRAEVHNFSGMLPAGAYPEDFQFLVNLPAEQHDFSLPMCFHVTHRDGNATAEPLDRCFRVSYDREKDKWRTLPC
jgi:hypothetical protein